MAGLQTLKANSRIPLLPGTPMTLNPLLNCIRGPGIYGLGVERSLHWSDHALTFMQVPLAFRSVNPGQRIYHGNGIMSGPGEMPGRPRVADELNVSRCSSATVTDMHHFSSTRSGVRRFRTPTASRLLARAQDHAGRCIGRTIHSGRHRRVFLVISLPPKCAARGVPHLCGRSS